MARCRDGIGKPTMRTSLTKREGAILVFVVVLLVAVSVWQRAELRTIQLEQKKMHYVERLRTAQLILENEMLQSAFFMTTKRETKALARDYLERFSP